MWVAISMLLLIAAAFPLAAGAGSWGARRRTYERLFRDEKHEAAPPTVVRPALSMPHPVIRSRAWIAWVAAPLVGLAAYLLTSLPLVLMAAAALIIALLGDQLLRYLAMRRRLMLETQLADAIDLMVGALGAGAGVTTALEAAAREAPRPLRSLLADVLGRMRLGDDPRVVLAALAKRVPLETFLLFSTALSVHWEVGGSLVHVLSSVGRTIRDRIELSRKVRSNSIQAQFSIVAVVAVTYFIALIMWRTNPPQMAEFLSSPTAIWLVAGSMLLQAIGVVWMASISRMKF